MAISESVALASEFCSTNCLKLVNGGRDKSAKDKSPVASVAVDTKEFYENLSAIQESLKPNEPRNSRIPKENKNSNEPRNSRIPKESGFKKSAKSAPKQPPKRARKDEK